MLKLGAILEYVMRTLLCVLLTLSLSNAFASAYEVLNDYELTGPNVCRKQETYPVNVVITEMQSYQERVPVWCVNIPPRCSSYLIKNKIVNKTQSLIKTRLVRYCCDGYKRNPNDEGCIPHCSDKCQHGKCVAPEKCKCEHGYGGPTCDIICRCHNNSSCDPDTDECICAPGWTGKDCSEPCPYGYYGMDCSEKCPGSLHGNASCNHVTGGVACSAGYIGLTCEHPCPAGYYGQGCKNKCACEHGGECHHITGKCNCLPGWTGDRCNVACPTDYYGANCTQQCRCQNHKGCRKNDGLCICNAGWMGTRCDEVCPEGFYGEHCMHACDCASSNFVCHAAKGCVCRSGYVGDNCDVLLSEKRIQESRSDGLRTTWSVVLLLIVLSAVLGLLFVFRRQISELKTELTHEKALGKPTTTFDNPVYGANNAESLPLRDMPPLRDSFNYLGSITELYGENSNASSTASYNMQYNRKMFVKNLNADRTNPNVYNSLEDATKIEHVYDEIKQKEGYREPADVYDHLDYSRPSTSQKPHYHSMNDTNLNINCCDEEKISNIKTMTALLKPADNAIVETVANPEVSICLNNESSPSDDAVVATSTNLPSSSCDLQP